MEKLENLKAELAATKLKMELTLKNPDGSEIKFLTPMIRTEFDRLDKEATRLIREVTEEEAIRNTKQKSIIMDLKQKLGMENFNVNTGKGGQYSITRALKQLTLGQLDGIEREVSQRHENESGVCSNGRFSMLMSVREEPEPERIPFNSTKGETFKGTTKHSGLAINAVPLITERLGVSVMTGLTGDVDLTYSIGNNNTSIRAEGGHITSIGFPVASKSTLSLKRFGWDDIISKENAMNMAPALLALLLDDAKRSNMRKIEEALLTTVGAIPAATGFLAGTDADAALTYNTLLDLEDAIKDLSNAKLVTNRAIYKGMRKLIVDAGSGRRLIEGAVSGAYTATGLPAFFSGYQAEADAKKVIIGNWSEAFIGFWGNGLVEIVVDPYTYLKEGKVEIIINSLADVKVRDESAFAVASNVLA